MADFFEDFGDADLQNSPHRGMAVTKIGERVRMMNQRAASIVIRVATIGDLEAMRSVMTAAIDELQQAFLSRDEIVASHAFMGLDTQLVADGTYFVAVAGDRIAGCGGWSRRATLYGGDHSADLREPRELDPATEAARVRAMYTHPDFIRRGIGRRILATSEEAARAEGFSRVELMSTLAGEQLYLEAGYAVIEKVLNRHGGVDVPFLHMTKAI